MDNQKPRIVKDFEKLDPEIQEQIKLQYPEGFYENLVSYYDKEGLRRSALPFETEEKYYLVRMSIAEAKQIIEDDDDYGSDGTLKQEVQDDYEEKHGESDFESSDDDDNSEDNQEEDY
ncbi:MAG: hypothetical protein RIC15_01235 [Vicingaceae bacterium]